MCQLEMIECYMHTNYRKVEVLSVIQPIMPRTVAGQEPDLLTWLNNHGDVTELEGAKITHHVALAMK